MTEKQVQIACKVKMFKMGVQQVHKTISEKAKPTKVGDAKLWVYDRENDYDRQAAEDDTTYYLC